MFKKIVIIASVLILAAVLIFYFGLSKIQLTAARHYYKEGDLGKAVEFYEMALKRDPDNLDANRELGLIYYKTKKYEKAVDRLSTVLEKSKDETELYAPIGISYFNLGNMERAAYWLHRGCVVEGKDQHLACAYFGMTLRRQRNLRDAISYLEKAVEIEEGYAPAIRELALAYWESGNPEKAGEFARKTVAFNPEDARIWWLVAEISLQQGEVEEAKEAFEKVIELNPEDLDAVWNLALAYKETGEEDKASVLFERIIERKPDDEERLYMGALLELELGNLDKAKRYADKLRVLTPGLMETHKLWLEIYRREAAEDPQNYDKVIEAANVILEKDPSDIDALSALGLAQAASGNYSAAVTALEKAAEIVEDERQKVLIEMLQQAHFEWGQKALLDGDKETAAREFQAAIDINPDALGLVERARLKLLEISGESSSE